MNQQAPDTETAAPAEAVADKRTLRRVAIASGTGSLIEYYDFLIYGTAAALVFPKVFFPALGAAAGTVASFATLGVAFVARPLGSIIFGHYGDRLGRKRTLVSTLLIMGVATVLIGLTPGAAQIGVAAPILLVLFRFLQGLAVGGEWTGATLLSAENAPKAKRGFWSMFASLGGALAICLANLTFLITHLTMSSEAFVSWGWRVPFLLSAVLVVFGLVVRLRIDETPVFKSEASRGVARAPFLEAFKHQPREMLFGSGILVLVFAFFYTAAGYLTSYGSTVLKLPTTTILSVGILGGGFFSVALILSASYSDRIGRRRVIIGAGLASAVWALLLFPILEIGTAWAFAVGVCGTLVLNAIAYGPVGAFLPELFNTRYRYTASGFCYNIAGVLGGAVPPIVAAALISAYGSYAFGLLLALLCLVTVGCTFALRETRGDELDRGPSRRPRNASASDGGGHPVLPGGGRPSFGCVVNWASRPDPDRTRGQNGRTMGVAP
ncbi:MHS family MFS transporter [Actinocorallia sp. API 0066]|uniref:MFS transporter n=1 Tax=Actinocorallia sp. API 0066 TaxID=2896846 RepID=UPI001E4AB7B1|nr:MFS transporter [Actinocorallia sp. API 0066]MCD0453510.1 MHS family MFS transporter [Actinocorallia sp. API 0066]